MRSERKELWLNVSGRRPFVNITDVVVTITGGRLGFAAWERIYQSQAE